MRTIVTAALQRQYLQTELILWIRLVDVLVEKPIEIHHGTIYLLRVLSSSNLYLPFLLAFQCLYLVPSFLR
jgi:hypothetical protein